jgi:SHAQKYF class myb-like DNA-binding protein
MFKNSKPEKRNIKNVFKCISINTPNDSIEKESTVLSLIPNNSTSTKSSKRKSIDDSNTFLGKKFFKVKKVEEDETTLKDDMNNGRWTYEEHNKFLKAIYLYGINWKKIRKFIDTRSTNQLRSHAQKFYLRLKNYKNDSLGIDLSVDSIENFKDMIKIIKQKELELNYDHKLLFILSEELEIYKRLKTNNNKTSHLIFNVKRIKSLQEKNILLIDLDKSKNNIEEEKDDFENSFLNNYFWKPDNNEDNYIEKFSLDFDREKNLDLDFIKEY